MLLFVLTHFARSWQIRLLVKAYAFLNATNFSKDDATDESFQASISKPDLAHERSLEQALHRIRRLYLSRIKFHIREALIWMLSCKESTFQLPTGKSESSRQGCTTIVKKNREMSYLAISIWHVWKYCAAALDRRFFDVLMRNLFKLVAIHPFGDFRPSWVSSNYYSPKRQLRYALSRWCHFGCFHEIYKQLADRGYQVYSETESPIIHTRQKWKGQCEKMLRLLRKAQGDQRPQVDPAQIYIASEDEKLDRFIVLCAELKLDPPGQNLAEACLKQTRAKLGSRKGTTRFNPGTSKSSKPEEISEPWELNCLNHHIRCMALPNIAEDDYSFEAKKNCFAFLSADYTFARSWNGSNPNMIGGWWDIEVSCVVCSTLLEERTARKRHATNLHQRFLY